MPKAKIVHCPECNAVTEWMGGWEGTQKRRCPKCNYKNTGRWQFHWDQNSGNTVEGNLQASVEAQVGFTYREYVTYTNYMKREYGAKNVAKTLPLKEFLNAPSWYQGYRDDILKWKLKGAPAGVTDQEWLNKQRSGENDQ